MTVNSVHNHRVDMNQPGTTKSADTRAKQDNAAPQTRSRARLKSGDRQKATRSEAAQKKCPKASWKGGKVSSVLAAPKFVVLTRKPGPGGLETCPKKSNVPSVSVDAEAVPAPESVLRKGTRVGRTKGAATLKSIKKSSPAQGIEVDSAPVPASPDAASSQATKRGAPTKRAKRVETGIPQPDRKSAVPVAKVKKLPLLTIEVTRSRQVWNMLPSQMRQIVDPAHAGKFVDQVGKRCITSNRNQKYAAACCKATGLSAIQLESYLMGVHAYCQQSQKPGTARDQILSSYPAEVRDAVAALDDNKLRILNDGAIRTVNPLNLVAGLDKVRTAFEQHCKKTDGIDAMLHSRGFRFAQFQAAQASSRNRLLG